MPADDDNTVRFQSTLPARGATRPPCPPTTATAHFNPRSLHGERPDGDAQAPPRKISIHAPCTGSDREPPRLTRAGRDFNPRSLHGERRLSDAGKGRKRPHFNPRSLHGERLNMVTKDTTAAQFQSTLPARGATAEYLSTIAHRSISIHAPCTGSDV